MGENHNQAVRLYSPALITLATFLGAPVAGCILLAHNCRALGKRSAARHWLLWGSVGTIVLLVVASFLPEKFPHMALPAGYTVGMHQAVKQWYGADYDSHIASGGAKGSAWVAVGTGLACLCAIMAIVFAVVLVLPE